MSRQLYLLLWRRGKNEAVSLCLSIFFCARIYSDRRGCFFVVEDLILSHKKSFLTLLTVLTGLTAIIKSTRSTTSTRSLKKPPKRGASIIAQCASAGESTPPTQFIPWKGRPNQFPSRKLWDPCVYSCQHPDSDTWWPGRGCLKTAQLCSCRRFRRSRKSRWIMLSALFPAHYSRRSGTSRVLPVRLAKAIRDLKSRPRFSAWWVLMRGFIRSIFRVFSATSASLCEKMTGMRI